MGFGSNGRTLVWKINHISINDINSLHDNDIIPPARDLNPTPAATLSNPSSLLNKNCKIDVDISWIVRKLGIGKTEDSIMKEVSNFLKTLAHQGGFIVTPICDGDERHHSKRDYVNRIAKRERKRVDGLVARFKTMSLEAEIENIKQQGGVESQHHLKKGKN